MFSKSGPAWPTWPRCPGADVTLPARPFSVPRVGDRSTPASVGFRSELELLNPSHATGRPSVFHPPGWQNARPGSSPVPRLVLTAVRTLTAEPHDGPGAASIMPSVALRLLSSWLVELWRVYSAAPSAIPSRLHKDQPRRISPGGLTCDPRCPRFPLRPPAVTLMGPLRPTGYAFRFGAENQLQSAESSPIRDADAPAYGMPPSTLRSKSPPQARDRKDASRSPCHDRRGKRCRPYRAPDPWFSGPDGSRTWTTRGRRFASGPESDAAQFTS